MSNKDRLMTMQWLLISVKKEIWCRDVPFALISSTLLRQLQPISFIAKVNNVIKYLAPYAIKVSFLRKNEIHK